MGVARRGVVIVLLAWTGCIEPNLLPCGDQICPTDKVCVGGAVCADPEQIAACEGLADNATCTVNGGVGSCLGGVCTAGGCGNAEIDPGEVCDDGNVVSGDGCRADCQKVEMCGDAEIDDGELCDDGNTNAVDGCDACRTTVWRATVLLGGIADAKSVSLGPNSIAVDRGNNLYATNGNQLIRIDTTGVLTTIAGTGAGGFGGDGGAATAALLSGPQGIAVDGLGNVFFCDSGNNRVRRIDPLGVITTIAGTGAGGYDGDEKPAIFAQLSGPTGVAVDGLGNVFIADRNNHRVRLVDTQGIVHTVAGSGSPGFFGDNGPATSAKLTAPSSVAVDLHGNIFISDNFNNRIRRVDTSGIITTFASGMFFPEGINVDDAGNVYVADWAAFRARRIDAVTGIVTVVAGSGAGISDGGDGVQATSVPIGSLKGIAVDSAGNVYLATDDGRVRRIDTTGILTTTAGSGSSLSDGGAATNGSFQQFAGIARGPNGNLYQVDFYADAVRRIDSKGVLDTVAGTGKPGPVVDGGPGKAATLAFPTAVAADASGNVFIADTGNHRVRRVDASGIITTVAGTVDGDSGDGGLATSAALHSPSGVALDAAGNLYISDSGSARIRKVDTAGMISTFAGTGTSGFSGDNGPATSAQLTSPGELAVASGSVYVVDGQRIRRIDAGGTITTVAGNGTAGFSGDNGAATSAQLGTPAAIAVDAAGVLYIADHDNQRVRAVSTTGTITTFAGTGVRGFDGDGGPALAAQLTDPCGIAVDATGVLYVSAVTRHVRRIATDGTVSTVVGSIDPAGTGPWSRGKLADPRQLALTPDFTLFAGGTTGTVEAARPATTWLEVVAGRYPQATASPTLARFRNSTFGDVGGVAYDHARGVIYISESSANRLQTITIVDPSDSTTWTIAPLANTTGVSGFADGAVATARFRGPTGLYYDELAQTLYVADTGNHVVRAIDLANGAATATVTTLAGQPVTRGFFGDGGPAQSALLFEPRAITRCPSGDFYIADSGNRRVRRIAIGSGVITTVVGDGSSSSAGEGSPASSFPVDNPFGLACDADSNLFVTAGPTVRLLPADANHIVDGSGAVHTIYGAAPRDRFPESVTSCLSGIAVVDPTTLRIADGCSGLLIDLHRGQTN